MLQVCSILVLYHLTGNDFTILNYRHQAGLRSKQTCFAETSVMYPQGRARRMPSVPCMGLSFCHGVADYQ